MGEKGQRKNLNAQIISQNEAVLKEEEEAAFKKLQQSIMVAIIVAIGFNFVAKSATKFVKPITADI